ncbi:methionine synthase [Kineococcus sp. NUM-3379]
MATAPGPVPGVEAREAAAVVFGELGAGHLPFLPQLPRRGPGADAVGRGACLLVDLAVDLQPSGWRFVDRPGRDAGRARSFLRADLDELAEVADGYAGPLKVQVAGPWLLAASVELTRGERSAADPGARRDLVASLAEGVAAHVREVRRLVPGARVVVQVDEPVLPAVLEGRLPTASGYGRLRAVEQLEVEAGLRAVLEAARSAGALAAVHAAGAEVPWAVLRAAGPDAVAVDVTGLGAGGWESLAATVEAGVGLWAGVLPVAGAPPGVGALVDAVRGPWRRVGLPAADLAGLVLTPVGDLAQIAPALVAPALRRLREAAGALAEAAAG